MGIVHFWQTAILANKYTLSLPLIKLELEQFPKLKLNRNK